MKDLDIIGYPKVSYVHGAKLAESLTLYLAEDTEFLRVFKNSGRVDGNSGSPKFVADTDPQILSSGEGCSSCEGIIVGTVNQEVTHRNDQIFRKFFRYLPERFVAGGRAVDFVEIRNALDSHVSFLYAINSQKITEPFRFLGGRSEKFYFGIMRLEVSDFQDVIGGGVEMSKCESAGLCAEELRGEIEIRRPTYLQDAVLGEFYMNEGCYFSPEFEVIHCRKEKTFKPMAREIDLEAVEVDRASKNEKNSGLTRRSFEYGAEYSDTNVTGLLHRVGGGRQPSVKIEDAMCEVERLISKGYFGLHAGGGEIYFAKGSAHSGLMNAESLNFEGVDAREVSENKAEGLENSLSTKMMLDVELIPHWESSIDTGHIFSVASEFSRSFSRYPMSFENISTLDSARKFSGVVGELSAYLRVCAMSNLIVPRDSQTHMRNSNYGILLVDCPDGACPPAGSRYYILLGIYSINQRDFYIFENADSTINSGIDSQIFSWGGAVNSEGSALLISSIIRWLDVQNETYLQEYTDPVLTVGKNKGPDFSTHFPRHGKDVLSEVSENRISTLWRATRNVAIGYSEELGLSSQNLWTLEADSQVPRFECHPLFPKEERRIEAVHIDPSNLGAKPTLVAAERLQAVEETDEPVEVVRSQPEKAQAGLERHVEQLALKRARDISGAREMLIKPRASLISFEENSEGLSTGTALGLSNDRDARAAIEVNARTSRVTPARSIRSQMMSSSLGSGGAKGRPIDSKGEAEAGETVGLSGASGPRPDDGGLVLAKDFGAPERSMPPHPVRQIADRVQAWGGRELKVELRFSLSRKSLAA